MKWLLSLGLVLLAGCSHTVVYHGGAKSVPQADAHVFLPPFNNATDDEHASRALTELTASALLERHIPLTQSEPALFKSREEKAAGNDGLYLEAAKLAQATHLLIGTVHEYRYKTDLDGDPAVGLTLRLVDAKTGVTLWQGSSAKVGVVFASLSKASQRAVRELVGRIPFDGKATATAGEATR